ncbi:MAG: hypothetical protein GXP24_06855 [Planctomycetes bacterium]|nr:hypothetical protein [Planctomycetota bacterium]
MGVYYYYVNDTKKQFFCIDPSLSDIKSYALGRNIGSRALSYLILENDPYYTGVEEHPMVGSWIGDRFFVTGDDYGTRFDAIKEEYADIGQAIVEMLVDICPFDLFHHGGVDWLVKLIENNGDPISISNEMRKRLSHEFRHDNHLSPNEDMQRVVAALRKGV